MSTFAWSKQRWWMLPWGDLSMGYTLLKQGHNRRRFRTREIASLQTSTILPGTHNHAFLSRQSLLSLPKLSGAYFCCSCRRTLDLAKSPWWHKRARAYRSYQCQPLLMDLNQLDRIASSIRWCSRWLQKVLAAARFSPSLFGLVPRLTLRRKFPSCCNDNNLVMPGALLGPVLRTFFLPFNFPKLIVNLLPIFWNVWRRNHWNNTTFLFSFTAYPFCTALVTHFPYFLQYTRFSSYMRFPSALGATVWLW